MTVEMIERVALALARARGHFFLTRETTTDDLHRTFGPQIFVEARAAIEAMRVTEPVRFRDPHVIAKIAEAWFDAVTPLSSAMMFTDLSELGRRLLERASLTLDVLAHAGFDVTQKK